MSLNKMTWAEATERTYTQAKCLPSTEGFLKNFHLINEMNELYSLSTTFTDSNHITGLLSLKTLYNIFTLIMVQFTMCNVTGL